MKLYRVMCRDEWDDLRKSGQFRPEAGQIEGGKWFATTLIDALVWGRTFPGTTTVYYHVVEIEISPSEIEDAEHSANLDGIGDAYFLTFDLLDGVTFRLVNPPHSP